MNYEPPRSITGPQYREKCAALGFDFCALAEMLGLGRRTLFLRFQKDAVVKTEWILALEMLEHRTVAVRYDLLMEKKVGQE